jgi:hypothetical protein
VVDIGSRDGELQLEPAVVLPAQVYSPWGARQPEKSLMLAVLGDAVAEVYRHRYARTTSARRQRREVLAWFASTDATWPFSFLNICQALGLDAGRIRSGIEAPQGTPWESDRWTGRPAPSLRRVTGGRTVIVACRKAHRRRVVSSPAPQPGSGSHGG